MAVKGNTGQSQAPTTNENKKPFEKKLYTGIAECTVVGINMDKEQMEALKWKVDKDPEYIDTNKDNIDIVNISIVLKENTTGAYLPLRFTIWDKEKDKSSTGKYQYLNDLGWEAWATSEEELKSGFAKRSVRRAKVGEAPFYNFMRRWLDLKGDDAELSFNLNKLLRGNFRELHDVVKSFSEQKVVVLATIHTYEKAGQPVQVQSVYDGDFLPAEIWNTPTVEFFNPGKKVPNDVEYFIKNVSKEKYGCKDYYLLEPFQRYPKVAAATAEVKNTETKNNYDPVDGLPF
jgi:hypothetical protein